MMREEARPWRGAGPLVKFAGLFQPASMNAKAQREKRLAAALRDNLRRRKAGASAQPAERDGDAQEDGDQGQDDGAGGNAASHGASNGRH